MLYVRRNAKTNTIADARRRDRDPIILGGTAEGATGNDFDFLHRYTLGLNSKLIPGYAVSARRFLCVDPGDPDGSCVVCSAISSNHPAVS